MVDLPEVSTAALDWDCDENATIQCWRHQRWRISFSETGARYEVVNAILDEQEVRNASGAVGWQTTPWVEPGEIVAGRR